MKRIISILILVSGILLTSGTLFAQGEAAVPFLLINPGARHGALGEAGVASPNDATAVYWNPAGLAFQYQNPEIDKRYEISFMHSKWLPAFNFDDMYYDYLAARFHAGDIGTFGGSITFLNLGTNVHTDETGTELGTFDSFEYAIALSYATRIMSNFGIGVNVKYISSNLSDVKVGAENKKGQAQSFAVDIGLLWTPSYNFLDDRLNLGLNLSNFGPRITYIDKNQADPLPTMLRAGLAVKVYDDMFNKITVLYDINRMLVVRHTDGSTDGVFEAAFYSSWVDGNYRYRLKKFTHALGLEYNYGTLIGLRAGYFYEDPDNGARKFLTFGAGIAYNIFAIDFSYLWTWAEEDHPLDGTLRFSVAVKF